MHAIFNADILTFDPCGAQQKGLYAAQGVISKFSLRRRTQKGFACGPIWAIEATPYGKAVYLLEISWLNHQPLSDHLPETSPKFKSDWFVLYDLYETSIAWPISTVQRHLLIADSLGAFVKLTTIYENSGKIQEQLGC